MFRYQGKSKCNIAVVGATGAVGREMMNCLEKRNFPMESLKLLASAKSAGQTLPFAGKEITIEELTTDSFHDVDIALFSAGGSISKEYAPAAVKSGAVVIDNSSAFRLDEIVPLVVPEVNPEAMAGHQGIIANPNCTTILMLLVVKPLHDLNPIKRVDVCTYQAVSGAGAKAVAELREQQEVLKAGGKAEAKVFSHVIADNLFSHDSTVKENGFNEEELKMVHETVKIMGDESIRVCPTSVRVPIERAHTEALHLEMTNPIDLQKVKRVLEGAPGVKICDFPEKNHFPMPVLVSGKDDVFVGRIRADLFDPKRLNLLICGDQLLKGAALNAVQIAEALLK
jgi:aspartate-semialdehyde dehydrogenase